MRLAQNSCTKLHILDGGSEIDDFGKKPYPALKPLEGRFGGILALFSPTLPWTFWKHVFQKWSLFGRNFRHRITHFGSAEIMESRFWAMVQNPLSCPCRP